ncbi:MAG: hypothetical protein J0H09_02850, partial [Burkholderiales bacterium]|nr:hypothetical protein [Burkholderiales bacterium]
VLTPAEAQAAKPLRIRIVTAGVGETIADMAARMPDQDRPAELFQLLNGLDRGAALVPGQRYKIIGE